ncbi:alpha-ribazole phosphatase [Chloroflexota bacterium]
MHLVIARHGLTAWNLTHRFQGQTDIPLNKRGINQAEALGERLANENIAHIYSSDLLRAYRTAQAVAQFQGCPLEKDARLRELNFGEWEGLTYQQIQEDQPQALKEWLEIPTEFSPPGGESLGQLAGRVQDFIDTIQQNHSQQRILLVAHGGAIQVLLCLALGLPAASYWQFSISQASLSELRFYPQGAIIKRLNDTCHLKNES